MNEKLLLLPCNMNKNPFLPRVLTFQEEMELRLKEWKRVANMRQIPSGKTNLLEFFYKTIATDEFHLQFSQRKNKIID